MPAFQNLAPGEKKRKPDRGDYISRKRPTLDEGRAHSKATGSDSENHSLHGDRYWMVQWRHPQYKKHKTWDGDAIMHVRAGRCTLHDIEGKIIGVSSPREAAVPLFEGSTFAVGGKDIEIDRIVQREDFLSGACFGRATLSVPNPSPPIRSKTPAKQFVPLMPSRSHTVQSSILVPEKRAIDFLPPNPISTAETFSAKNTASGVKTKDSHWAVNWRKPQGKKHKTWDGDAFISQLGDKITMISEEGEILGVTSWKGEPLHPGYELRIGGKEVELDCQVTASQLPIMAERMHTAFEDVVMDPPPPTPSRLPNVEPGSIEALQASAKFVPPTSFYGAPAKPKAKGPLHDPDADDAVVMKMPTEEHQKKFNKKNLPIVPVVLDPILARHMRAHQKEGVKFLYECVMGIRKHEGQGCILADEMGLGKTLQTIGLVWTLLKQNPYSGVGPVLGKTLVVCPVSLVNNWRAEFQKWLGRDRIGVFVGDKDKSQIKQFINSRIHHVLVIGYERLRTVIDDLAYCQPPIGLVICDEGHRLKSATNKTTAMFKALRTPRRVILSGTPVQNDLGEFHAMAEFCNPGLLDDYSTFRRVYEVPILKSRAPDCSAKETEIGEARSKQLLTIRKSFVLRRDANILKNYLPPKYEYVVFVTATALQLSIFSKILHPDKLDNLMQSSTAESLALINMLTKISNSPILLRATADKAKSKGGVGIMRAGVDEALSLLPERAQIEDFSMSGKLAALSNLLKAIRHNTEEKCILVSHYTSTLNILEAFCKKKSYTYYRLDGQTPATKRQEYVNSFNKSSQHARFIFLLSSKAGGVGLNLIGASRLCLIDSDWNPSHDLQSMARIHRDGQKRPVFIYRFLTAGTIDEKIYQRQVTKLGLTNSLMGTGTSGTKSDTFSRKDLRDIFRIHPDTACNTHDLLECPCDRLPADGLNDDSPGSPRSDEDGDGEIEKGFIVASEVKPEKFNKVDRAYLTKKKVELAALGEWTHINCLQSNARDNIHDDILRKLMYVEPSVDKVQPQSRLDSLLSSVDLDSISALDEERVAVRDVPGGTISFIFERASKTSLGGDGGDLVD